MTEQEIKLLNYNHGRNNYILRGNAKWVAFQKHIVEKLRSDFLKDFNIVIYWYKQESKDVDYICVPYKCISSLLVDEHLSYKKDGSVCWNFIIKDDFLMVHANSKYSLNITPFLNTGLPKLL
jgi:hypothetical protein